MVKAPLSAAPLALAACLALQAWLSPVAAQPIRITGRVTPSTARVELHPAHPALEERLRDLAGGTAPAPLVSARPRPDGTFEIAAPGPGFYRVVLRAEGLVPLETSFSPLLEPEALAPARLTRGAPLEVHVLGSAGAPEKGIEVRVSGFPPADRSGRAAAWRPVEVRGVTGEDGRVALPRRRGDRMFVSVTTPRFLEWLEDIDGTTATLRLRQRPARVVEVRGPEGRPAPGTLVSLHPSHPLGVSGAGGRLALPVLDQAGAELLLEAPGGLSATLRWPAPGSGPVAVTLAPPRLATGRVLDASTSAPLPGALVWSSGSGVAVRTEAVRSGAGGEIELRLPPARDVHVSAAAVGYLQAWQQVPPAVGGEKTALLLKLVPAATLAGLAVDDAGRPVAGARIEAEPRGSFRGMYGGARAESGPDGRFVLEGLAAGGSYELRGTHETFAPVTSAATAPAPGKPEPEARVVFSAGWSATGRVVDGEGRPVAGASLSLLEVTTNPHFRQATAYEPGRATADAAGRFRLLHLPPRPFDLVARAPGFGPLQVPGLEPPAAGAPGDAVLDLGDVVLPPGVAIEGRVTDRRGSPLAEATVGLMETVRNAEPSPNSQVTTGPDGRFRLTDLRQGERYDLWVRRAGHASTSVPGVEAPTEAPLRVELRPARGLAGRVVGPAGEPVPHASLNDFEESGEGQGELSSYGRRSGSLTQADAEGRFRVDGLKPGPLNLEVQAPGYKIRELRSVVIPEESDLDGLEIVLERGAVVTGRVLDARGEPVAGVHVSAMQEWDGADIARRSQSTASETDGEGRYRLGGLDPGKHRISAHLFAEDRRAEAETVVRPGENVVNLSFRRTTQVSGRVVDESGEPVSGASVSLNGRHDGRSTGSGTGGLFHFPAVEDGDYALSGGGPGFVGAVEPVAVEVDGRPVRDLELRLRRGGTLLTGRVLGLAPGDLERVTVSAQTGGDPFGKHGMVGRDGTYRLPDLQPGTWEVTAALDEGRRARGSIQLEAGQERAVLDLEITSGPVLTGRVLADGAPLAGARILLSRQRGRGAETATVHDGRFRLEALEPGAYVLLAVHSATGLGTAQAVDLSQDRDLLVEIASGAVRGQVLPPPGEPAAGLDVFLEGTDPALGVSFLGPSVQTDDQGSFEIPRVAAGRYRLIIRRRGSPLATAEVRVEPGEAATVRVEAGAGGGD